MLDSYFFIPGNKPELFEKIKRIDSEFFIIDLEDSVKDGDKKESLKNVLKYEFEKNNLFIRSSFLNDDYSVQELNALVEKFNGQIVIPKLSSIKEFESISEKLNQRKLETIVLVESPEGLLNLQSILEKFSDKIKAIGFGTHDFCSTTGIKHCNKYLLQYKQDVVLKCKAFNVKYIDGVCLNIYDDVNFEIELKEAFDIGSTGKFIIHPKQFEVLKKTKFFSKEEISLMNQVVSLATRKGNLEFDIIKIDKQVFEKPHIQNFEKILKRLNYDSK